MAKKYVLAIDQGSTSSRTIILNKPRLTGLGGGRRGVFVVSVQQWVQLYRTTKANAMSHGLDG